MEAVLGNLWQQRVEKLKEIAQKHGREFDRGFTLGWSQILIDLNEKLEAIVPEYSVGQIKQKFGGLRFYINPIECSEEDYEKIQELILESERKSVHVCEICGEPGDLSNDSWVNCFCIDHFAKSKEGMSFSEMTKEFYLQCGFEWKGW